MSAWPPLPTTRATLLLLMRVGAALSLVAGGLLGLLYTLASYEDVAALGGYVYHENGFKRLPLALTPGRLQLLRAVLLAGAGLGAVALLLSRHAKTRLGAEWRHGLRRLVDAWQRTSVAQRAAVGLVLMAVLAARAYYLLAYPLSTDEIASYDFFVRKGPLAITGFYPIPNNHILYNLLAWPATKLPLTPRWVMRLPTLLLGSVGTVAGLALLARVVGQRLAVLVTGLVALGPVWVYYAGAGRGYFLQFCALQMGFFAAVEIMRPRSFYPHLRWLGFVSSSVVGLYLIPTYAYPLLGLLLGVGGTLSWQRRWNEVAELALAGAIIGGLTLLLYAPVGVVSGWDQLLHNPYVSAREASRFWPLFRPKLYETAAELFGPPLRYGGPLWLGAALVGGLLSRWLLPPGPRRHTALLAWVLLALPLLLMAAQRVNPLTRVLLHLTFFGYLLAVLWLSTWHGSQRLRPYWLLGVAAVLGLGGWRLYENRGQVRALQHETRQLHRAYAWLSARPGPAPRRVWLNAPFHELYFAHYAHTEGPVGLRLTSSQAKRPAAAFDFLVLDRKAEAAGAAAPTGYVVVYRDDLATIYAPSAGQQP